MAVLFFYGKPQESGWTAAAENVNCPMIEHLHMGSTAAERSARFRELFRNGKIAFGGYRKGRIYGTLRCASGKRMLDRNRVFFASEEEALAQGYRPCGHCLPAKYKQWKAKNNI